MHNLLLGSADADVFGDFRPGNHPVLESAGQPRSDSEMDALILEAAETQLRAAAMGAALTWIDDGDWTADTLDALAQGLSAGDEGDEDDEGDMSDDEQAEYDALLDTLGDAFVYLGADEDNVEQAINGDDDACQLLGQRLSDRLDETTQDDDDLVSEFSVGGTLVMESLKKVIRDGEVKWVRKKKRRRKKRLTAKQRAALKKARRKSNNAAAKRSRKRSMRRRRQMGL